MEDTNSFDQQPQNRTYTSGKPSFVWPFRKPGSLNSKITNQSPTNEQSHTLVGASEFRPLGRGGSGARSRKASRSNAVVLESNVPHQPPEAGPCRPFGRGGYGSLAKRPLTPSNPPTAILDLLRGHEAPSPIRAQSRFPRIRCHIQKDCCKALFLKALNGFLNSVFQIFLETIRTTPTLLRLPLNLKDLARLFHETQILTITMILIPTSKRQFSRALTNAANLV